MAATIFTPGAEPGVTGRDPEAAAKAPSGRRSVLVRVAWVVLVAPFVVEAIDILRSTHVALVERMPDDAFYYVEIASRVARGQGFSFDGIHETNGFHPLWQFALVPVASMLSGDALIRGVLLLALACALIAVLLVVRLVRRVSGLGPALLGGIVATQFALPSWVNGMEGAAVLLAAALLATALAVAARTQTRAAWVVVGLASSLLVLARLDFALILPILGLALWLRVRSWRAVAAWIAGGCIVGVPFGAWWIVRWHHVLTTSATVKRAEIDSFITASFGGRVSWGYADYLAGLGRAYLQTMEAWAFGERYPVALRFLGAAVGLVLIVLGTIGAVTVASRWPARRCARVVWSSEAWSLAVIVLVFTVKAGLDLVVAPFWAAAWYAAPQRMVAGFVVGALAWIGVRRLSESRAGDRRRVVVLLACIGLALVVVPVNAISQQGVTNTRHRASRWQDQLDLAATWIARQGPTGVYGARDAGLLGARLDGHDPVVNLDGLVNDYGFASFVAHGPSIRERVADAQVEYYVGRLTAPDLADLTCGHLLWRSPGAVLYGDAQNAVASAHVYVLDMRHCRSSHP